VEGCPAQIARQKYALGDVNVSLIHTMNGKVITIYHDTTSPRESTASSRIIPSRRTYIEGRSPGDVWETEDKYQEFDHPIWKKLEEKSKGAGHGGMDFVEDYRLIEALQKGRPLDMDVYDAAAWSMVSPLSERSVADKSKPVSFPDFTRGGWKTPRPLHIMEMRA
jgi:hypothetical protein